VAENTRWNIYRETIDKNESLAQAYVLRRQETNEPDDGLNVCDLFNGLMSAHTQIRDEWRIATVSPEEDAIDPKYLQGHTQCIYVGS